ncbi:MAG: hypothetical protein M1327_05315 [Candidatus Thermoplasmatota archaeon]|nr:hypothetical protein [Candidatus Thermoplasmatota archaeon]
MMERFVVLRNGVIFQYCDTRRKAEKVVRNERVISKILRVPVKLEIIREDELRKA